MGLADACTYGRPCRCRECATCEKCGFQLNVKSRILGPRGGLRWIRRYTCPCIDFSLPAKPFQFQNVTLDSNDEMCKYCMTNMKKITVNGMDSFICETSDAHSRILYSLKQKGILLNKNEQDSFA